MISLFKRIYRNINLKTLFILQKKYGSNENDIKLLLERITNHALHSYFDFSFEKIKDVTLSFVKSINVENTLYQYKYSKSCTTPNIYSSAYACLILSMYSKLNELTVSEKKSWVDYFDSFQNSGDGLFYDESLRNDIYDDTDWWGAKHLALHLINAYIALGAKPKYPFYYLEKYYDIEYLKDWLAQQAWFAKFPHDNDIDNKIMNIVTALQYQRDYWNDINAGRAIIFIQQYLLERINPDTGMWGYYNLDNKDDLSRMVQFAYHLLPMFFYDNIDINNKEIIIDLCLKTQNIAGGFGVKINSSACEDIDSIDILIRFSQLTSYKKEEIDLALKRAFIWVLANQNNDGGFVFRRNEAFMYGHEQMSSGKNESALFPTWFRTLTIGYLSNYFYNKDFFFVKSPGFLD